MEIGDTDVPKYRVLADQLLELILSGDIPPRSPLPSKARIQQETGLAGGTIDKAMRLLKDAGYVRTVIGLGLFVTPSENWPDRG